VGRSVLSSCFHLVFIESREPLPARRAAASVGMASMRVMMLCDTRSCGTDCHYRIRALVFDALNQGRSLTALPMELVRAASGQHECRCDSPR
jgi:hypothetical protein